MKELFKVGFTSLLKSVNNVTTLDANSVPEGYVDLGLPSGTLWASCNLGASKPEEYGKYCQWGDTIGYEVDEARAHSYWRTSPFNNGKGCFDEEYFNKHKSQWLNGDTLKPECDAIYQATSGLAHIPTNEQCAELKLYTTNMWVENYNNSGVNGRKFISKTNPDKYIFIPAGGVIGNYSVLGRGVYGCIWSSSLYSSNPNIAYDLYFDCCDVYPAYNSNRDLVKSIRGVIG